MGVVKPEHKGRGADAKAGRIKPWFAPISRALYRPGPRGQAPVAPLASKTHNRILYTVEQASAARKSLKAEAEARLAAKRAGLPANYGAANAAGTGTAGIEYFTKNELESSPDSWRTALEGIGESEGECNQVKLGAGPDTGERYDIPVPRYVRATEQILGAKPGKTTYLTPEMGHFPVADMVKAMSAAQGKDITQATKGINLTSATPVTAEEKLFFLETVIGYTFRSTTLGLETLQGGSETVTVAYGGTSYNVPMSKRLAIFGDAILSSILSEEWYEGGGLCRNWAARSGTMLCNKALAEFARQLGFDKCLVAPSVLPGTVVLATTFEAVVGAVMREAGWDRTKELLWRLGLLAENKDALDDCALMQWKHIRALAGIYDSE